MLKAYFSSWWLPATVFLVLLGGFAVTALPRWRPLQVVNTSLLFAAGLALVGILAAAVWNLARKRKAIGIVNLILLPVCGVVAIALFVLLMLIWMFGTSDDGFADNLAMPTDIEVAQPGEELEAQPGSDADGFQAALLTALQGTGSTDTTVSGRIESLARLQREHPDVLRRYLAASPAWRVFEERGSVYATRRWMIGPAWRYELHGYYTRHDIDTWSKTGTPDFQSRFTIGLSGKPWGREGGSTTRIRAGENAAVTLSTGNQMHQSDCVITSDELVVEVFEQSAAMERRLTKAALGYVEAECAGLVNSPTWATIRSLLPAGSIRRSAPSLELRNSFQPGLYDSIVWVNPGEPGMLYLKAFEVTKGTPLSVDRLKEKSNEWPGWSEDPEEVFLANAHFTIYEGDWGKPYAARFEVWFVPDSGAPERLLVERTFRIEGWQR